MADVTDHLKELSSRLIESLNTRTYHLVAPMYMDQKFGGSHLMDATPSWSIVDRDDIVLRMVEYLKRNPSYHTEIQDISVHIESPSRAKVWIRRTVTGLAEGHDRETLAQLAWVLKYGRWLLEGYQGMRGFSFYGGDHMPGLGGI